MTTTLSLRTEYDENGVMTKRGWIYDANDQIVCRNLPFPTELVGNDTLSDSHFPNYPNGYSTTISHEGTHLRLFYFDNEWRVASNRRYDARQSRWGGARDFYTHLQNAFAKEVECSVNSPSAYDENTSSLTTSSFDEFLTKLNPEYTYVLLLKSTIETRLVCREKTDHVLYHIATIDTNGKLVDDSIGLDKPKRMEFATFSEMLSAVKGFDPYRVQGIFVICPDGSRFKILNEKYAYLSTLRNNNSYLDDEMMKLHYTDSEKCDALLSIFPEYYEKYQEMFIRLQRLYAFIQETYSSRYVKRQYIQTNARIHRILADLYRIHGNKPVPLSSVKTEIERFGVMNALNGFSG
jgi:hypothetical protein